MVRKKISKALNMELMYDSSYACVVCQQKGSHIHHIDGNNSNNEESNLVFLCNKHHDEAHTKHQLSKNLSPDVLKEFKKKWLTTVKKNRNLISTTYGQLQISGNNPIAQIGISWGYINHKRVAQLIDPTLLSEADHGYFKYCLNRGLFDEKGVLLKPEGVKPSDSYIQNSIYDWFEHGDDQRLHKVYTAFVNQISMIVNPIHIESENFNTYFIDNLVSPGDFVFINQSFYFKGVSETIENQHRKVHVTKNNVSIDFFIDTVNMFGATSMTVSFSGHRSCAAFLQLKSLNKSNNEKMTLHCTPIALGVGFNKHW